MRKRAFESLLALCLIAMAPACTSFTSINRDSDGKYVITGVGAPAAGGGFVWICTYDPATKTMTVIKEE